MSKGKRKVHDSADFYAFAMSRAFVGFRKACAAAGETVPARMVVGMVGDAVDVSLFEDSSKTEDAAPLTASACFAAYNAGGPSERANLTWDGKPVPAFDAVGPVVQHKWQCAAFTAALKGAEYVLELMNGGITDPETLRLLVETTFHAPAWSQDE